MKAKVDILCLLLLIIIMMTMTNSHYVFNFLVNGSKLNKISLTIDKKIHAYYRCAISSQYGVDDVLVYMISRLSTISR